MSYDQPEFRSHNMDVENNLFNPESSQSNFQFDKNFIHALEESIPSGISVINESGEQVYVNESFCKMFGWDKSELLGKNHHLSTGPMMMFPISAGLFS